MSEAASHAASLDRRDSPTLEEECRPLFGKHSDAIEAHLVVDAGRNINPRDEDAFTHHTWIASYALARAATMLAWAFTRIQRLELEALGQSSLFDPEDDDAV